MNRAKHGKWNLMQKKCHVLEMVKSAMRSSWTYKLGENIISIAKEEKFGIGNTGQLITRETYK